MLIMDSVTQALFFFQFSIPILSSKQVRSSVDVQQVRIYGKRVVKAVMLLGNIKDLNAKIWK